MFIFNNFKNYFPRIERILLRKLCLNFEPNRKTYYYITKKSVDLSLLTKWFNFNFHWSSSTRVSPERVTHNSRWCNFVEQTRSSWPKNQFEKNFQAFFHQESAIRIYGKCLTCIFQDIHMNWRLSTRGFPIEIET